MRGKVRMEGMGGAAKINLQKREGNWASGSKCKICRYEERAKGKQKSFRGVKEVYFN